MIMQGLHYDLDSLFPENPDFLQEEEMCLKDHEQFKRIYPLCARDVMPMVEDYLDRFEYEGSPIFDEYPDKVTMCQMAEEIYELMHGEDEDVDEHMKDIILIMLCNNMYIRRRRHDRFTRLFQGTR